MQRIMESDEQEIATTIFSNINLSFQAIQTEFHSCSEWNLDSFCAVTGHSAFFQPPA